MGMLTLAPIKEDLMCALGFAVRQKGSEQAC